MKRWVNMLSRGAARVVTAHLLSQALHELNCGTDTSYGVRGVRGRGREEGG